MLFTIPYNLQDPEHFIKQFEPYSKHIHSFYLGLPGILPSHNPNRSDANGLIHKYGNALRFLELTKNSYTTVLCINTLIAPINEEQFALTIVKELAYLIDIGNLNAVNVASPTIASIIHEYFPNIDIQTSCNTFSFLTNMYKLWHENFGTTVFNLPREAMRTPRLLEEFKQLGYISKCIVNENCIYGCPGNIEHACSFVMPECSLKIFCDQQNYRLSDIFRGNFIPPHRLKEFEGKVDIAKIAGRFFTTEQILHVFLSYLYGDENTEVTTLLHSRNTSLLVENRLKVYAKDQPKKTLTCECKECDTCNICEKAMRHVIKRQGINVSQLTRSI